jgi:hypothetical protein
MLAMIWLVTVPKCARIAGSASLTTGQGAFCPNTSAARID